MRLFALFAIKVLRHRFDAVHPRAQVDAIEVELEDFRLAQAHLDQERNDGFFPFAGERGCVGKEERAGELLGQGAAAFGKRSRAHVLDCRACQADGIDAGMRVEASILDGDHRPLEIGRNLIERHVPPLFIEAEPWLRIGAIKDGVADSP